MKPSSSARACEMRVIPKEGRRTIVVDLDNVVGAVSGFESSMIASRGGVGSFLWTNGMISRSCSAFSKALSE